MSDIMTSYYFINNHRIYNVTGADRGIGCFLPILFRWAVLSNGKTLISFLLLLFVIRKTNVINVVHHKKAIPFECFLGY